MHNNWWQQTLYLVIQRYAIAPADFWNMTLPELKAVLFTPEFARAQEPISCEELQQLMEQFPDKKS